MNWKIAVIITTCFAAAIAGNYVVYQYIGLWNYVGVSLICGVIWSVMTYRNITR